MCNFLDLQLYKLFVLDTILHSIPFKNPEGEGIIRGYTERYTAGAGAGQNNFPILFGFKITNKKMIIV